MCRCGLICPLEFYQLLVQSVTDCQKARVLKRGPSDVIAAGVWSLIHGCVSLSLAEVCGVLRSRPPP
jgi:hypothetical protein